MFLKNLFRSQDLPSSNDVNINTELFKDEKEDQRCSKYSERLFYSDGSKSDA